MIRTGSSQYTLRMQKDDPLQVDVRDGSTAGTRIYQITGPITLPNLFTFQDSVRRGDPPQVAILDLTQVPYMDSAGMGSVINYFTHCQRRNVKLVIAGVSPRVSELFKMTGVDTLIPMKDSIEAAEALA
jgi:anti-sigma B factor antagonist